MVSEMLSSGGHNQETLLAIVRAARARQSPVLVAVSHDEVSMIGLANIRSQVDNYRAATCRVLRSPFGTGGPSTAREIQS
jgi:hypothetical protein